LTARQYSDAERLLYRTLENVQTIINNARIATSATAKRISQDGTSFAQEDAIGSDFPLIFI
jgi:hypothetical protein